MTELLPEGDIHLSLLPPAVRAQIGEVGPDTVPARRMLENLGFEYHNFVDPFDGGPYITAKTDEIELINTTFHVTLGASVDHKQTDQIGIVSVLSSDGDFRAVQTAFQIDRSGKLRLTSEAMMALHTDAGVEAGCTPMRVPVLPGRGAGAEKSASEKTTKKKTSKKISKKVAKKATKKVAKKKPAKRKG